MNQTEMREFFQWCDVTLKQFTISDCDESEHYYLGDVFIGGWAGDRREFFYKHSDQLAQALRMFDAERTERPLVSF